MRTDIQDRFIYLGTNENGTETFLTKGDNLIVKSYLTGYVRRIEKRRNWYTGFVTTATWQINRKHVINNANVRIMEDTHDDRYDRMVEWDNNRNK